MRAVECLSRGRYRLFAALPALTFAETLQAAALEAFTPMKETQQRYSLFSVSKFDDKYVLRLYGTFKHPIETRIKALAHMDAMPSVTRNNYMFPYLQLHIELPHKMKPYEAVDFFWKELKQNCEAVSGLERWFLGRLDQQLGYPFDEHAAKVLDRRNPCRRPAKIKYQAYGPWRVCQTNLPVICLACLLEQLFIEGEQTAKMKVRRGSNGMLVILTKLSQTPVQPTDTTCYVVPTANRVKQALEIMAQVQGLDSKIDVSEYLSQLSADVEGARMQRIANLLGQGCGGDAEGLLSAQKDSWKNNLVVKVLNETSRTIKNRTCTVSISLSVQQWTLWERIVIKHGLKHMAYDDDPEPVIVTGAEDNVSMIWSDVQSTTEALARLAGAVGKWTRVANDMCKDWFNIFLHHMPSSVAQDTAVRFEQSDLPMIVCSALANLPVSEGTIQGLAARYQSSDSDVYVLQTYEPFVDLVTLIACARLHDVDIKLLETNWHIASPQDLFQFVFAAPSGAPVPHWLEKPPHVQMSVFPLAVRLFCSQRIRCVNLGAHDDV